jgi:hypothetical protein
MLTRKEMRAGHVALWTWLAETGSVEKGEWPGWGFSGGEYCPQPNDCFACGVAYPGTLDPDVNVFDCKCRCPISWPRSAVCPRDRSEYAKWIRARRSDTRKRYAAKIAALWPEEE